MFSLLLSAAIWNSAIAAETGCQTGPLEQRLSEPLDNLRKLEIPLATRQSTEGGIWEVFFRPNGDVHSIVRRDFGETGQYEARLSLLDREHYAINEMRTSYEAPISTSRETVVKERASTRYFFCDQSSTGSPEAQRLKALFFEADEIARFVGRR